MDAEKEQAVEVRMPAGVEFDAFTKKAERVIDIVATWDLATERYLATGNGRWLIEALRDLYRARPTLDWPERELLGVLENPPARLAAALSKPKAQRESVTTTKRNRKIRVQYENELKHRPGMKKGAVVGELAGEYHLSIEAVKGIVGNSRARTLPKNR